MTALLNARIRGSPFGQPTSNEIGRPHTISTSEEDSRCFSQRFFNERLDQFSMAKLTPKDLADLSKVINVAMRNRTMHKGLATNPAATVDRFSSKIGFDSSRLSQPALHALGSVTEAELKALSSIHQKATAAGAPDGAVSIAF
jgi:hypothetical protein